MRYVAYHMLHRVLITNKPWFAGRNNDREVCYLNNSALTFFSCAGKIPGSGVRNAICHLRVTLTRLRLES